MFTKKHYEQIAQILYGFAVYNGGRDYEGGAEVDAMVEQIVVEFADNFERENWRFNRVKFYKACGLALSK